MAAHPSPIHKIRLRGPWSCEPLAWTQLLADGSLQVVTRPLPPPGTLTLPADWSAIAGADFRGRVKFTRRFGRPTGLDAHTCVMLVVDAGDQRVTIELNGESLGEMDADHSPWRQDVTARLQSANELVIVVELPETTQDSPPLARPGRSPADPGGLIGEVRLEIVAVGSG